MVTLDPPWTGNPIFQRNASGVVSPVVTGTYDGTPDYLEGQVAAQSGAVVIPWFPLADNLSGGAFSGAMSFQAQPGWLQLQVREHDNPSDIATSAWFGTGDVWIIGGQSIAERLVGQINGPGTPRYPMSCFVPDIAEASALFGNQVAGWQTGMGVAGCDLGNVVCAKTGVALGFIFLARGGVPLCKASAVSATPLKYLLSREGSSANFPDEQFLTVSEMSIASCGSGGFAGLIFIGNEQDTIATPLDQVYLGLNEWLNALTGGYAQVPVVMSLIGSVGGIDQSLMRAEQIAWATNTPGGIVGASRQGLPTIDGTHPTSAGMATLAAGLAMNMLIGAS